MFPRRSVNNLNLWHTTLKIGRAYIIIMAMMMTVCGCSKKRNTGSDEALRQVLRVQRLQNLYPDADNVPEMEAIVDSMGREGKSPYYFAALNVMTDRLFSDGRYAEADSMAVRMRNEAIEIGDSLSIAMAKRARAQILYKLWQPERALEELQPASRYIARPLRSGPEFATAASIDEWLWIISRSLGDTAGMNRVGKDYARLVEEAFSQNSRIDTTGHFPVTAIAFQGEALFTSGDTLSARSLLSKADTLMLPDLPARAYEHLFEVRALVRAADNDLTGALADVDTLLSTHKNFPRFYLNDLLLKARILEQAGRHEESATVYSRYIAIHDSISSRITDQRLQNLTVLYRSEIDREQRRAHTTRMFALASVIILLLILLLLSSLHAVNVRRKNLRLVERLKEFDRATATSLHPTDNEPQNEPSLIDRLDRHMATDRPYTNPGLSRKELAEFAGISQEAIGNLIKEEKGCSVKSYINTFRLDEARRLLESDSAEPIATIATRLGFGTPRTLQRAFKERFDMSPSQYRDAISKI